MLNLLLFVKNCDGDYTLNTLSNVEKILFAVKKVADNIGTGDDKTDW